MKNIFSIPVHEHTEAVIDLVLNLRRFCPASAIVIHISRGFNYETGLHTEERFRSILAIFDNVFVNPVSLETHWADILHAHVSNFKFVSALFDFKTFSLISSNELFVREMPTPLPEGFDAGFEGSALESRQGWRWYKTVRRDPYFTGILRHFGADFDDAFYATLEGTVYSTEIFSEMAAVMDRFYDAEALADVDRSIYPREEIFLPTLAHLVDANLRNTNKSFTYRKLNRAMLKRSVILNVAEGKVEGKYSVKRIARMLDEPNRIYIGEKLGGYREQTLALL